MNDKCFIPNDPIPVNMHDLPLKERCLLEVAAEELEEAKKAALAKGLEIKDEGVDLLQMDVLEKKAKERERLMKSKPRLIGKPKPIDIDSLPLEQQAMFEAVLEESERAEKEAAEKGIDIEDVKLCITQERFQAILKEKKRRMKSCN